jgi:hypothetical protein
MDYSIPEVYKLGPGMELSRGNEPHSVKLLRAFIVQLEYWLMMAIIWRQHKMLSAELR